MKAWQFGLIGKTLGHSFSKKYFTEKFNREGWPFSYDLFPLENISELTALVSAHPDLKGLNVTIPYKQSVIPLLDELDAAAEEIGAVNTILVEEDKLTGFNTDVIGFSSALDKFYPPGHTGAAIILGTGGAARAADFVLRKEREIAEIIFVSRGPENGNEISYSQLATMDFSGVSLIVNATPLGMYPQNESCPEIPYPKIGPNQFLFDMVYNPSESLFLRKGKERGCQTENGINMLHSQAEAAWNIWEKRLK